MTHKQKFRSPAVASLLTLSCLVGPILTGCSKAKRTSVDGESARHAEGNEKLATVGTRTLTVADFREFLRQNPAQTQREGLERLFQSMTETEAAAQAAISSGFLLSWEVRQALAYQYLEQSTNRTAKPSQREIEEYYQTHNQEFSQPARLRLGQIVVQDENTARALVTELRQVPDAEAKRFQTLVAKHSTDHSSRSRYGDLGDVNRRIGEIHPDVLAAAAKLALPGQISDPVKTEQGFHVLRLTEKTGKWQLDPSEVESVIVKSIMAELKRKTVQDSIAAAKNRFPIKVIRQPSIEEVSDHADPQPQPDIRGPAKGPFGIVN